jgi:hypothetical protein
MPEHNKSMSAEHLRPGAEVAATHEAGHAVTAAYLHVPIAKVELSAYWLNPFDLGSGLAGGGVSYLPSAIPQLDEHAIITAAARVAVDELVRFGAHPEIAYVDDEDCLKEIASELGISDFQQWRVSVMERARTILRIEYVRTAIRRVASDLQTALLEDRELTGEHICEVLQACEMASGTQ